MRSQPAVDGGDVDEDAGLVVGRPAREEPAVALFRLERVLDHPFFGLAGRLHVVMRIEQERRPALGLRPLAVRVRVRVRHLE